MKPITFPLALGLLGLLMTGCAHTTVDTRKQERSSAYSALSDEYRNLVDQGTIKIGMPMDAVYIAWGKPDQVLNEESPAGMVTTWLYHDTHLESYRYWTYDPYYYPGIRGYRSPYLAHDYYVRPFISAEVVFEDGNVKLWRTLPRPVE